MRRVGKWVVAAAAVIVAAVAVLSTHFGVDFTYRRVQMEVGGGGMWIQWTTASEPDFYPADRKLFIDVYRRPASYPSRWGFPRFGRTDYSYLVWAQVPIWLIFVMLAIPSAFLWYRDRRPPRPGHCQRCGYDLTGNVSGRCSECGREVS